jgi:hypothetical protein
VRRRDSRGLSSGPKAAEERYTWQQPIEVVRVGVVKTVVDAEVMAGGRPDPDRNSRSSRLGHVPLSCPLH